MYTSKWKQWEDKEELQCGEKMLDVWHGIGRKWSINFQQYKNREKQISIIIIIAISVYGIIEFISGLGGKVSDVRSYHCSADIKRAMTIYASWRSTPQQLKCSFCALLSQYTSKLFLALIATVSVLTSLVYQVNKQTAFFKRDPAIEEL